MAMRTWTQASITILGIVFAAGLAFAAPELGEKSIGEFDSDDGTYAVEIVSSDEECKALCEADGQTCRGTVIYQPDTSKPEMQCRLNNGFGEAAVFRAYPQSPLILKKPLPI